MRIAKILALTFLIGLPVSYGLFLNYITMQAWAVGTSFNDGLGRLYGQQGEPLIRQQVSAEWQQCGLFDSSSRAHCVTPILYTLAGRPVVESR